MDLISLPYDIRYLIYSHVFPATPQIHIHAIDGHLRCITPEHDIPTALLRVCKALGMEASEYLYNNYLFNILGTKKDCLATYNTFLKVAQKYARDKVHIHAFSNGIHSVTGCLSIHAGDGKALAMLRQRQRGQPKTILELQEELKAEESAWRAFNPRMPLRRRPSSVSTTWSICVAVLAIALAVYLSSESIASLLQSPHQPEET